MEKLGATGKFPFGKLAPDDQGELRTAISYDQRNEVLRIDFGKPVDWLALKREGAFELAKVLLEKIKAKKVDIEL